MYCARLRRAEASRASTRTALWAENPVCRQASIFSTRDAATRPSRRSKASTSARNHGSSTLRGMGGSTVNPPSASKVPSAASTWIRVEVDEIAEGLDEED